MQQCKVDVVIIGGGIAGLMTLAKLRMLRFNAILLESNALGAGQTIASQGIIHGGLKYALGGFLTKDSESIANMPAFWNACLQGKGEFDLRTVSILSSLQYLWSNGSLSSNMSQFFASKSLSSRINKVQAANFPPIFQNAAFKGTLYQMEEVVINITSLLETLTSFSLPYIYKIDETNGCIVKKNQLDAISHLEIRAGELVAKIEAQAYIFAAGANNVKLLSNMNAQPNMQLRPLHMVMVKSATPYTLFGHCTTAALIPQLTVTTHMTNDKQLVWYLGGKLAEDGIHLSPTAQHKKAHEELTELFPWIDLSKAAYASFMVDRAEGAEKEGKRPSQPTLQKFYNYICVWPTKLALTPLLVQELVQYLQKRNQPRTIYSDTPPLAWAAPLIATPPWDKYF